MKKELKNTWLVQRLCKPYNTEKVTLAESFAFGGGLKNGGLSDEAMKLLRPIFSFDYMGSAEFEFGEVPKCFQVIAKNIKQYSAYEIEINKIPVFVISDKETIDSVNARIKKLAKDKLGLKERSGFPAALGLDKWSKKENCRYIGWLELDNRFMFFTNKEAFERTANLFELTINQVA